MDDKTLQDQLEKLKGMSNEELRKELEKTREEIKKGNVLSENEQSLQDETVRLLEKSAKETEKQRKSLSNIDDVLLRQSAWEKAKEKVAERNRIAEESGQEETLEALKGAGETLKGIFGIQTEQQRKDKRKVKKMEKDAEREMLGIETISMPKEAADWMGAIVGAITAFIGGVAAGIAETVAILIGSKNVKRLMEVIKAFSKGIGNIVTKIKDATKFLGETKVGGKIVETFKVFSGKLKAFFGFITAPLREVSLLFGEVKAVTKFAEPFFKFFSAFKGFFQVIGKFVGRLLIPLFATIEAITTAIEFFKATDGNMFQKIVGAFFGAITGVVDFLVVSILEMGKKLLSWVAGMFGLTGVEEFLDSFDLSKLFKDLMQGLVNIIINPIDSGMKAIKEIGAFLDTMFSDLDEKIITPVMEGIGKFLSDMGKAIAGVIHLLIDGVVKFSTSLPAFFMNFFKDMTAVVMFIPKKIFAALSDTVDWVVKQLGFENLSDALMNPIDLVKAIVKKPYELVKDAVAWVMGKLGFEEASEDLKNTDVSTVIKNIIMAPYNLLKKAVSWVLETIGFGADGTGEGDIEGAEKEEGTILSTILKIVTAPYKILGAAVDYVLGLFGFDALKTYIPDVGSFLKSAADTVTDVIKDSINFIKDKLMFWKKKSQDDGDMTAVSGGESIDDLKDMGVLTGTGKLDPRDAKIEDEAIKSMSMPQLDAIAAEYPDKGGYKGLHKQIREEKSRRLQPQTSQGNLGTAMQTSSVAVAPESYTGPMVTATGQQAAQMSNEMNLNQQSLNNSQAQQNGGGATSVNTSVNAPVTNSSSTVNNFTSSKQPSAVDFTDYNAAFNATGSSR